jgi:hypothetical protein
MNIEYGCIPASAPEKESEQRWNQATRAVVGLSVCACLLLIPKVAHANIFTSLISAVTNIGSIEAQLNGSESSMNNYNNNVVVPPLQLASLRTWLNAAGSSYQNWFTVALNIPIRSATLSSTSTLENAQLAGYSGETGSGISANYSSVYGTRLSSSSAGPATVTGVDMSDTAAQEAMALATNSDNTTMQLLSVAKTLQQKAASTAPGTSGQVEAQAQALQLQSNAMMHHILASMLRQASTQLATDTAQVKSTTATHGNILKNITGGN